MTKTIYTANRIRQLALDGSTELCLAPGDIVTPLARDDARVRGITIYEPTIHDAPSDGGDRAAAAGGAGSVVPRANGGNGAANGTATGTADGIEAIVRRVVSSLISGNGNSNGNGTAKPAARLPAVHIPTHGMQMDPFPFEINRPTMDVRLRDVITGEDGFPMAAGFLSLHAGSFPWHLDYDEVELVLEGELHLGTPEGTLVALPGDVLRVPKGTDVTFGTPSWVKLFYVTYPADWAG